MKEYLLSIYIPTFNRAEYLEGLLDNIYTEIPNDKRDLVEIVVSDNASEDDTESVASRLCAKYNEFGGHFKYHRNLENIGSCRNFLQCTDYVNGEWCWLVGDDDMVLHNGINVILNTLCANSDNKNINYYCLNYAYITMDERSEYLERADAQKKIGAEQYFFQNTDIMLLDGYSELFGLESRIPAHIGTFLGGNLFRVDMWKEMKEHVDYTKNTLIGVNEHEEYRLSADYVFPHLIIAGKACMNERIGYIGVPCIGLGVGAQENSSQNWRFIDTVVFDDLLTHYREYGMSHAAQDVFINSFGADCGKNLAGIMAGQGAVRISQETAVQYLQKYGSSRQFSASFIEGISYFLIPPLRAGYNAFAFELLNNLIKPYIEQNMRIAIWGTGEMAQSMAEYCEGLCEHVMMLIDGSRLRWGKKMNEFPGLLVQSPESLKTHSVDMIFISSVKYADEIIEQIKKLDIRADVISCKGKMTL